MTALLIVIGIWFVVLGIAAIGLLIALLVDMRREPARPWREHVVMDDPYDQPTVNDVRILAEYQRQAGGKFGVVQGGKASPGDQAG